MFHSYYSEQPILQAEAGVMRARLSLCRAVAQVIKNGLNILGVAAPEQM
jgi:arginyl-tRNA synthetase